MELCTPMVILITGRSAFADEATRKAAWFAHRDRVLRRYRDRYPNGHSSSVGPMPAAFWAYEAPQAERHPYPYVLEPKEC